VHTINYLSWLAAGIDEILNVQPLSFPKGERLFYFPSVRMGSPAFLDLVTGKFNPVGRMPFSTLVSEAAAQRNRHDVPGYDEGADYPLFKFDEGMNY